MTKTNRFWIIQYCNKNVFGIQQLMSRHILILRKGILESYRRYIYITPVLLKNSHNLYRICTVLSKSLQTVYRSIHLATRHPASDTEEYCNMYVVKH